MARQVSVRGYTPENKAALEAQIAELTGMSVLDNCLAHQKAAASVVLRKFVEGRPGEKNLLLRQTVVYDIADLVDEVVGESADVNDVPPTSRMTALHRAAEKCNVAMYQKLKKLGAKEDVLDRDGRSPRNILQQELEKKGVTIESVLPPDTEEADSCFGWVLRRIGLR